MRKPRARAVIVAARSTVLVHELGALCRHPATAFRRSRPIDHRRRTRRAARAAASHRLGVCWAWTGRGRRLRVAAGAVTAVSLVRTHCDLEVLRPVSIGQNSFVYAADGSSLGSIPAERNRQPVALTDISPWMRRATIAVEDRRFYRHGGVDYEGIARALWRDITKGEVVEGRLDADAAARPQPLHLA